MPRRRADASHSDMPRMVENIVVQAGVVPWRVTVSGDLEVLLVTSLRKRRWTIPKGNVPRALGPAQAALREALEEAGVLGRLDAAIGSYSVMKGGVEHEVTLFPMEVSVILPIWPEAFKRQRCWMPLFEAIDAVHNDDLRACLVVLSRLRLA